MQCCLCTCCVLLYIVPLGEHFASVKWPHSYWRDQCIESLAKQSCQLVRSPASAVRSPANAVRSPANAGSSVQEKARKRPCIAVPFLLERERERERKSNLSFTTCLRQYKLSVVNYFANSKNLEAVVCYGKA